MDQMDIYANVEKPSGNPGKKKNLVTCSESFYANQDKINIVLNRTASALSGAGNSKRLHKSSCRVAAVFLGLLCLLLLAGIISLVFLFTKGKSEWEMEMVILRTSYNNLTKERDQLQTSYNNLAKERDQLQTSYNNLAKERAQLQTSYNNLAKERAQLQTSYNNLAQERDQLQTSYNNLAKERAQLQKTVEDTTRARNGLLSMIQGLGWVYFSGSFYYMSSLQQSWQDSRADCLRKSTDLVIINSKEEQVFASNFQRRTWIGMTDIDREGAWKWVDGTQLTTSYWISGEPNGGRGENCAEIRFNWENSWNDQPCSFSNFWICEKRLPL